MSPPSGALSDCSKHICHGLMYLCFALCGLVQYRTVCPILSAQRLYQTNTMTLENNTPQDEMSY